MEFLPLLFRAEVSQTQCLLPLDCLPDFDAIIPIVVIWNIFLAVHPFGFDFHWEAEGTVGKFFHCSLDHLHMSTSASGIRLQCKKRDTRALGEHGCPCQGLTRCLVCLPAAGMGAGPHVFLQEKLKPPCELLLA